MNDSQRAQAQGKFGVDATQLKEIVDGYLARTYDEDLQQIEKIGGVDVILEHLKTSAEKGIDHSTKAARDLVFGSNLKEKKPRTTFCELLYESLQDFMLQLLLVCAAFSLVTEMVFYPEHRSTGWIDGTCIFLAVAIVSVFTAVSDYNKETQFIKQQALAELDNTVSKVSNK